LFLFLKNIDPMFLFLVT